MSVAALLLLAGGTLAPAQAPEPRRDTCEPLRPDTVRPGDLFACALDAAPGLLVIGSVRDDLRATDAGAVYVFDGDAPPLRLAPDDLGPTDRFGYAVDVDAAGGRFVVSTPFHDAAGRDAGGAWVYARGRAGWGLEAKLVVGGFEGGLGPVDQLGYAVAIDGPWAAVGAPGDDRGGDAAGAVYLFRRGETGWAPVARLQAADPAVGDGFGASLAMGGGVLLVGAPFRDAGGREAGAAYVFALTQDGGARQVQVLTGDGGAGALFGHAAATDGERAVISARRESAPGDNAGAVYVYRRAGDGFVREQRLEVPGAGPAGDTAAGDELGTGLALDGDRLAAGARFDDLGAPDAGAVWTFRRGADGWTPDAVLRAEEPGAGDELGYAVAISGERLVAGAYLDDDAGTDAGTACLLDTGSSADLSVSVVCQSPSALGGAVRWTVRVRNAGPGAVPQPGALVTMPVPAGLNAATATCTGPPGSPCMVGGSGFTARAALAVGGTAVYALAAAPAAGFSGQVRPTATVQTPAGFADPNPADDRATCAVATTCVNCTDLSTGLSCTSDAPSRRVSWTATVTNRGPSAVPAPGATVNLPLPAGVDPSTATCATGAPGASPCTLAGGVFSSSVPLANGAAASLTVSGIAPPSTTGALVPSVSASLAPPLTELSPADNSASCTIPPLPPPADLAVSHVPQSVVIAELGLVTFRLQVTNVGGSTARSATLTTTTVPGAPPVVFQPGPDCAADPAAVPCPLGDLDPGDVRPVSLTYLLPLDCPQSVDAVTQTATVGSTSLDPNPGNDVSVQAIDFPVLPCATDLRLTKSGPATATAGGPLVYAVTVSNLGSADVDGARVLDVLPDQLVVAPWTCGAAGGAACGDAAGAGDLDETVDLPAGSSVTYTVSGTLSSNACGEVTNGALVVPPEGVDDDAPANDHAEVTTLVFPASGVCATKELQPDTAHAEGSPVGYRVLVLNAGPGPLVDNVGPEFRDVLPAEVILGGASADSGTISTAANTVTWDGDVPAGGSLEILITGTVDQGTLGQTICNQGEVLEPFVLTDDPDLPGPEDPTCFTVVVYVPTLSPLALALLALLLAAAGALQLRRLGAG